MDSHWNVDYPLFDGPHGPTVPLGIESRPIDFFDQLLPDYMIETIVQETNRYARQKNRRGWDQDTNSVEMRAFFGILYKNYNANMGAIDRHDQMMKYYGITTPLIGRARGGG
jgi:hypothetical protein